MVSYDDSTARSLLNRWGATVTLIKYSTNRSEDANRRECGKHGISKFMIRDAHRHRRGVAVLFPTPLQPKDGAPRLPTGLHGVVQ